MGKYLYVEARGWFEPRTGVALDTTDEGRTLTDDPISFDSIVVEAPNADIAYTLGNVALQAQQKMATDQPTTSHMTGSFLNDYVVKL